MQELKTLVADGRRSIHDMAPKGRVACRHRDGWRLRSTWDMVPDEGEIVEFVEVAQGREDFRTVLQIAAVVAAVVPGLQPYAFAITAASVAYNLVLPPTAPDGGEAAKSVFNASVSGNTARLDQPIWRVCGVDRITPPFAAQPYVEFLDDDGDNVDNEQYFYAVLAVSYGPVDLLADFLGKTPVNHYQDILVHKLLQPGEQPTIAKANVYTSQDVSGFELTPITSVGSYVACPPTKTVEFIGIDIVAPQGLGTVNGDGDARDVEVKWKVQARRINDAGAPLSAFQTVVGGEETRKLSTNTPQRWSGKYPISPPGRVEVRVYRTNSVVTGASARDSIQWTGLRGYSSEAAPLDPNTSHYELVLRATKQLSQTNQTDINMIVQGKARTWTPGGGWSCAIGAWGSYVATRNPAWWLADLWSDPNWGEGLSDSRIDLQALYDLSLAAATRQDRCDYTFSQTTDAWAASQLLARTARARVFRRYGVRSLKRDELAELGETAFTPRVCRAGTQMSMTEKRPQSSDPDGIIAEYRSNVTWDIATVECPCPGVVSMTRPVFQRYAGIQGYNHARREGLYDAADMALRQRTVQFETEMAAVLTSFLAPVRWMPQIPGYGQTGDVAFWNAATKVMGLTEPADFSNAPVYLTLRRDDGTLTDPVVVTPGPTANDVTLPAAPDFSLILDDANRARPVFLLGPMTSDEIVKVASIKPVGGGSYSVTAVVDNSEVHAADNAFLPGPGDNQDPIGLPGEDAADDGTQIVVLEGGTYTFGDGVGGGGLTWNFSLNNDGSASIFDPQYSITYPLTNQWVASQPIETSIAALYEVFLAPTNPGYDASFSGAGVRTWLNLGTSRAWVLGGTTVDRADVYVDVTIRRVDDGSIQTVGRYLVQLRIENLH